MWIVVNFVYMVEGRDYLKWCFIGVELDNGFVEDWVYIFSCKDWKDLSDRECGVRIWVRKCSEERGDCKSVSEVVLVKLFENDGRDIFIVLGSVRFGMGLWYVVYWGGEGVG